MHHKRDIFILVTIDTVMLSLAWLVYYEFRIRSGLFPTTIEPDIIMPMLVVDIFWLLVFGFIGLYRPWYAESRFDELTSIFKAVTVGAFILFFAVFIDDARTNDPSTSRLLILVYWFIVLASVGSGRMIYRSVLKRLIISGIGRRAAMIIGTPERAEQLHALLKNAPALGYTIVGFLNTGNGNVDTDLKEYGTLNDLEAILERENIQEVLIALPSTEHDLLVDIVGRCSPYKVGLKIQPDMYDIISGQARTHQIYGVPLMEIMPELMQPWERVTKRIIDIIVSLVILVLSFPLWIFIALGIKLSSRGPILYRQERVGKDGKIFRIIKFRSMRVDAEKLTGPRWADKDDPRVTSFGKILRKTHLDEIPQLLNVLEGDMSLVGPRPERPYFVDKFTREIALYRRRLNVRPGITGWAQVKHKYDESLDDVRTKLRYDLFYIENMSVRMDLKILLHTLYNVFTGQGHA